MCAPKYEKRHGKQISLETWTQQSSHA